MRRSLGTTVAALALAVVVGCTGPADLDATRGDSGAGAPVMPGEAAPTGPAGAPDGSVDTDRQVVTSASAFVAVDDPADGAQRVSELVEAAGGRVEERREQAGSGKNARAGASADLVVRVPADELTDLLADLEEIGDVESVSVSRSDVTNQAVDLDARISALQTSTARLQTLMDRAGSTAALLDAEKALSERQAQLESLQSQRALLADQVELSTLSVHLEPFGVAPAGGPDSFLDGLTTGWRSLIAALGATLVVLGVVLPWLAIGGVVAATVLVSIRVRRRSAPPPPVAPEG